MIKDLYPEPPDREDKFILEGLTLEQQFEFSRMQRCTTEISKQQALELLQNSLRLISIKEKFIENHKKKIKYDFSLPLEVSLRIQILITEMEKKPLKTIIQTLLLTVIQLMLTDNKLKEELDAEFK